MFSYFCKKNFMDNIGLSEQEILRRESLKELRNLGINPYPAAEYPVNIYTIDIHENFSDENMPESLNSVCLAGRIMSRRIMGNASFAELQDSKGKIQLYFNAMRFL
jgi:lysyl-tRNA synthetase class 2